jgi:PAS domain S-box-containing protein
VRSFRRQNSASESEIPAGSAALLASEFSEFISAASKLESSYRALQDEVSELGRELSERNAALNTSLQENQRMRLALEQIVDSMPCGVLVLDQGGSISMINPESKRLLGVDGEQFGDWSRKTLAQISTCSGVNLEASCRDASGDENGLEFCVRTKSTTRWIEVRNRRLFHHSVGGTRVDQTILILRDISAQKRAEQEREAGRQAMALAELTTILAHEIRNPLASLELFAELIEQDGGDSGEWIANLRAGIRTLSGTVNNVLSFHGSGSLTLAPIDMSAVIRSAIDFARPIADQAAVSLEWLSDEEKAFVMGNECALRQVVLNLVSNAIRHTPAGGSVTVLVRAEQTGVKVGEFPAANDNQFMVEFADTGCGIRVEQIDHIFEPGFSGNGDTTGLGLSVCAQIMKQHGGRISAANRKQAGALFTFHIPRFQMELVTA